jgi:hypothetical protein
MYWCPQVSSPPNEAHPDKAPSNYYVTHLCLANIEIAYLCTSLSGMEISQDRGCRRLLVYINDLLAATSTTTWDFSCFLWYEPCYIRGPEVATSFAHGATSRDAEGRWC